jgi:hypothetical protein
MKYALGNMLNGAGGLNPDGLALDLQFAADKTLTARRGPTPVLTRGSTGTFVGSDGLIQTAAVNAARFDHDPVTLESKGLLIEEGRTNLLQRSENFANTFWTKTRSSIQSSATTAPDGTTTADKLIEDASASNTHLIGSTVTPPSTPHTLSVFAKKGERDFIVLRLGGQNDFFNLNTGVALTNINSPTITNYGNGWYRCTVTNSLGTQGSYRMSADGITDSYTGDGTSGIFIWGAQLEAGSFPTSYIPTTTSALARSADVCSITGADFDSFYNNNQLTILTDAAVIGFTTSNAGIVRIAGVFNIFNRFAQGNRLSGAVFGQIATAPSNYNTAGAFYKSALSADTSGADFVINGTQITDTFTGGSLTPTSSLLTFNDIPGASCNTWIKSFRYYRKMLPVSKLQALTA